MLSKIFALLVVISSGVLALSLKEAKSSGQVCEAGNGFVKAKDGSPEVQALVDDTNAKRTQKYAEIAAKDGTDPAAVAAIAAGSLSPACN